MNMLAGVVFFFGLLTAIPIVDAAIEELLF
jgi:hypothetical protein